MKVEILENFEKWYDYFYGHDDIGTKQFKEEQSAIDRLDELYKNNEMFRTFMSTMAQVRGDCFTSDRELAAFMLAYEETAKTMTERYKEVD